MNDFNLFIDWSIDWLYNVHVLEWANDDKKNIVWPQKWKAQQQT